MKLSEHKIISFFFFVLLSTAIFSQQEKKTRNWTLNGHLQDLGTVWIQDWDGRWQTMNQVKNRFDFRWFPSNSFSMHIGMRNNFTFGMMPQLYYPYMADLAIQDPGYLDMTRLVAKDTSYFMISNLDRAYLRFSKENFQVTAGRQRINWGINMVWNPNDITPLTILISIM